MNKPALNDHIKQLLKRLRSSTAVWFILLLLLVAPILTKFDPLTFVAYEKTHPFQQIQRCATYKFQRYLAMPKTPDIVIVGSSLPMCAIYYWDMIACATEFQNEKQQADKINLNILQSYNKACYISKELSKSVEKPVSLYNLTVAASMVSDVDLLISKLAAHGKLPKIIIYGIFPRDFSDNLIPPIGETPTFKAVGNWQDVVSEGSLMKSDVQQNLLSYSLYDFFRVKDDYRTLLTDKTAQWLHHPRSMAEALAPEAAVVMPVPGTKSASSSINAPTAKNQTDNIAMAKDYHDRFYPTNALKFEQEVNRFVDLMRLCKSNNVKLIVINMPLSTAGKAVLSDLLYESYVEKVTRVTRENDVPFIDMEAQGKYADSEFIDIMHLNKFGGEKFQNELIHFLATRANEFHLR